MYINCGNESFPFPRKIGENSFLHLINHVRHSYFTPRYFTILRKNARKMFVTISIKILLLKYKVQSVTRSFKRITRFDLLFLLFNFGRQYYYPFSAVGRYHDTTTKYAIKILNSFVS